LWRELELDRFWGGRLPPSRKGHNGTPVVLKPQAWPVWLGEQAATVHDLKAMLVPYPSDDMICWPVSARGGNVRNNDSSLMEPIVAASTPGLPQNLDDHSVMMLDIFWTIKFFPLARPTRKPRPPPPGFSFRGRRRSVAIRSPV
jgi:hypothetical protein